jgi:formylglycine-generating enzyme required for sulfatase activity
VLAHGLARRFEERSGHIGLSTVTEDLGQSASCVGRIDRGADGIEEFGCALAEDQAEEWRAHIALDEAAFETVLNAYFPEQRYAEPRAWQQRAFNHPSQPVIGISYFEALAYCHWLSATSGRSYRLPSEAEWASAARGYSGLRYAWGDAFEALLGNVGPTRWRASTPVGVFPEGRSAQGVDDLSGNCFEWTCSLYGTEDGQPEFGYPYRADDGREDQNAPAQVLRVARGGSWADGPDTARCAYRYPLHPALRHITVGFRLVFDSTNSSEEGADSRSS